MGRSLCPSSEGCGHLHGDEKETGSEESSASCKWREGQSAAQDLPQSGSQAKRKRRRKERAGIRPCPRTSSIENSDGSQHVDTDGPTPWPLPGTSTSAQGVCSPTAVLGRGTGGKAVKVHAAGPLSEVSHSAAEDDDPSSFDGGQDAHVGRNVPGFDATPIDIGSMWRTWPHKIFTSATPFGRFYRAQCSKSPRSQCDVAPNADLWPCPLPYHGADLSVKKNGERAAGFRHIVNLQISFLSFLHVGQHKLPPDRVCGPVALTDQQKSMVRRVEELASAWAEQKAFSASDMGRTAAKQERQEEILKKLETFSSSVVQGLSKYQRMSQKVELCRPTAERGKVIGHLQKGNVCTAQRIVADRIKMGKPVFDPTPFLDSECKKLFEEPFCQGINPDSLVDKPPRVRVHASLDEKIKLLRLLNKSGRLVFRKPAEIIEHHGNGLFCCSKEFRCGSFDFGWSTGKSAATHTGQIYTEHGCGYSVVGHSPFR